MTGASTDIFNNIAFGSGVVGDPRGIAGAIEWLKAGPFKEMTAKIVVKDASGAARVEMIKRQNIGPVA